MMRWAMALIAAGAFSIGTTFASDGGPLVDALVKKGVLSAQEGEEIRMEMQQAYMGTTGGMLSWGNSAVKGVKLYGDIRLRYQWDDANGGGTVDDERQRLRYRMRIGADYQFADNFRAGMRFETGAGNNTTNNTFGDGGNGPFDDTGDALLVGLAYLTYENDDIFGSGLVDNVEITLGKMKNQFMIDGAFWDSDINPEGAYQAVSWDGVFVDNFDITLRTAQYIMTGDDREGGARNRGDGRDKWHGMYKAQMQMDYEYSNKSKFSVAPMFLYADGLPSSIDFRGPGAAPLAAGTFNRQHTYTVLMLPMEYKFKAFGQSNKLKATYGVNLSAEDGDNGGNGQFAQIGYKIGSAKKKGSWQIDTDFRYLEEDSMPNYIVNSNFYSPGGNQRTGAYGYMVSARYALTDNITVTGTWFHAYAIENDSPFGDEESQIIQADLNWKF
ncbi:MAG: putative porin [Verrucomicrobiota bacterium]